MTGAPIDNAITNTVLPDTSQGQAIPDSIPTLTDTPQLVMTPGAVRPNYLFADGGGVSGIIGQVYTGYGYQQGGTSIVVNDGGSEDQFSSAASEDEDIWQYSTAETLWLKRSFAEANLMKFDSVTVPPVDGEVAVYDSDNSVWIPQPSEDIFAAYIPEPINETIPLAPAGLAYDVEIVSSAYTFGAGPGIVNFPVNGTVFAAGTPITISIAGTSGSSANLQLQLNYKRRLAP